MDKYDTFDIVLRNYEYETEFMVAARGRHVSRYKININIVFILIKCVATPLDSEISR